MDQTPDPQMTRKVLLRAAEILEAGWCRGHYCATPAGQQVDVYNAEVGVDRFCVQGAILKATQEVFGIDYTIIDNPKSSPADYQRHGLWFRHPVAAAAADAVGAPLVVRFEAYLETLSPSVFHPSEASRAAITRWNDDLCRTGEEAAALVRATAERL
jgi:hypothetical protein